MGRNKKVTLITGCFQLFNSHAGHWAILRKAKSLGDKLIVLLNSDAGTFRLKGYLAEKYGIRANNLLKSGLVDEVIEIYTDPTPWIEIIKPDYWVLGSDHEGDSIVERCKERGWVGEAVIFPRIPGVSSSKIFARRRK